jgi:hypothetical protein
MRKPRPFYEELKYIKEYCTADAELYEHLIKSKDKSAFFGSFIVKFGSDSTQMIVTSKKMIVVDNDGN